MDTSDDVVERLQPFGRVSMMQHEDDTWSATCHLRTPGVESRVKSGFGYGSMKEALLRLEDNLHNVLEGFTNALHQNTNEKRSSRARALQGKQR